MNTDKKTADLEDNRNIMVYVDGSKKAFRCDCGSNCFHLEKTYYICNGCGQSYSGDDTNE